MYTNIKVLLQIANRIYSHLPWKDVMRVRGVNKDWNANALNWLRLKETHQTLLNSEEDARTFLQVIRNSMAAHPFSYLTIDLWEVSIEIILNLTRETEDWMTGLTLSGVSPGYTSPELFRQKDILTKVAVMLHGGSNLNSLSIRTDFQIDISPILELVLPRDFRNLQSLVINILYSDNNCPENLLEMIFRRSPKLHSLGILLPEFGGDEVLIQMLTVIDDSNLQRISLSTPISSKAIQALKNANIKFSALRIRITDFGAGALRNDLDSWLTNQSETLVTLGLTLDASSTAENLLLPPLKQLEMLSLLVVGSTFTPLQPFHSEQFPKLSSVAFVQSSAELSIFSEGVFPGVTSVGLSGKNGNLDGSLAQHLPNLQHVTLCGVSPQHLMTLLSKLTSILELVLIFEGKEIDYWDEFTGGAPRSWEELYDRIFLNEDEGNVDEEWEAMTSRYEMEEDQTEFCTLFSHCLEGLDETANSIILQTPKLEPASLANMKCTFSLHF